MRRRLVPCLCICGLLFAGQVTAASAAESAAGYVAGRSSDTTVRFDLIVPTVECTGPANSFLAIGTIFGEGTRISWSVAAKLTADCTTRGSRYRLSIGVLTQGLTLRTRAGRRLHITLHQGADGEEAIVEQGTRRFEVSDTSIAVPSLVQLSVLRARGDAPFSPLRLRRITVNGKPFSSIAPSAFQGSGMRVSALTASGEGFTVKLAN